MLRQEFSLTILLDIAQLPRATFYYHLKRMKQVDKYETAKQKSQQFTMKTREDTAIAGLQMCCAAVASL